MTKRIILGSMESDAAEGVISLLAKPTASQYETFQISRGGKGEATTNYYQVPTGYELVITAVQFVSITGTTYPIIGYGDTAVANGTAAPTNAVGLNPEKGFVSAVADTVFLWPTRLGVPAGKYPYVYMGGSGAIILYGFLRRA